MSGNAHFRALSELVAQVTDSMPAHLLVPMARYLVAKGVVLGGAGAAVATSPREFHASLLEFLQSQQAPAILKYVVLRTLDADDEGSGPTAPEGLFVPSTPDFSGLVRELKKDREFQVASLAPLEHHYAADLFEHVVALLENPRPPRPRPMSNEPTWVPNDRHPWPSTGQVDWPELLASVESVEIREDFRPVIAQHRTTGYPDDVYILNAIQRREQTERVRASLAKVLELPAKTARDCCQRWAALIDWGQQQLARTAPGSPIDLKDEVFAHASYGTPESTLSNPLLWATEAKAATVALHPLAVDAGFEAADLILLHALGRDLDRILDGKAVDIQPAAEKVRLIVAEIEIQAERPHGDADDRSIEGAQEPSARDSWPPPEHATVAWATLRPMEQDIVRVFLAAVPGAVLEVPWIASKARGVAAANRHDYAAASSLEMQGILKKAPGRTGRSLAAVPKGMPPTTAEGAAEVD